MRFLELGCKSSLQSVTLGRPRPSSYLSPLAPPVLPLPGWDISVWMRKGRSAICKVRRSPSPRRYHRCCYRLDHPVGTLPEKPELLPRVNRRSRGRDLCAPWLRPCYDPQMRGIVRLQTRRAPRFRVGGSTDRSLSLCWAGGFKGGSFGDIWRESVKVTVTYKGKIPTAEGVLPFR